VITTGGIYPWSSVTQIFRNDLLKYVKNLQALEYRIYSIFRCIWNFVTYKYYAVNGKIEIISFVVVNCQMSSI
jgi:hypothetical protein